MVIDETNDRYIEKLPKKSDIVWKIDTHGLNTYRTTITPNTADIGIGSKATKERYDALLQGKITDKDLKDQIMSHSNTLIKNRISMQIILTDTQKGISGVLVVTGILPEWENHIKNFFMDKTIGSNEWYAFLKDFQDYMQSIGYPVTRVYTDITPSETLEINEITIKASFQ